jgi:hypothetical protein
MKLVAPLISLLLPTYAFATLTSVAYNPVYDQSGHSLNTVACSNPLFKEYGTFGKTPNFPRIGAAGVVVGGFNPKCGTCWNVTYPPREVESYDTVRRTIQVFIVDSASKGLVLSLEAMNQLTNGKAVVLGRVNADFDQVSETFCGVVDKYV